MHVGEVPLGQVENFKFLIVTSDGMSEGRQNVKLEIWVGQASTVSTVMRDINRSVVMRKELRTKAKLSSKSSSLSTLLSPPMVMIVG